MVLQARKGAIALDDDLEKSALLPTHNPDQMVDDEDHEGDKKRRRRPAPAFKLVIGNTLTLVLLLLLGAWVYYGTNSPSGSTRRFPFPKPPSPPLPPFIDEGIAKCEIISRPPPNFSPYDGRRQVSDRFVKGTKPVWLKNGTLWTGEDDGEEIRHGTDVLLERGVIRAIGSNKEILSSLRSRGLTAQGLDDYMKEVDEVELSGAWVTPGIVDLHSHLAVGPSPALSGAADGNSLKSPILPWLRSLDAFNTHDQAFNLSISGGITTMLVLPGSAGNIGGQAFTFKPRWTAENTPQSMQVEPPFVMQNGSWHRTGAWRHIKHACGENPHRVYGNTRLDSAYDFRRAYLSGQTLKEEQERWCASPKTQTTPFPDSLEWEALADAIRGNVKVNIHCYETVDLNDLVRISNEFQFHIAAFHHAHETYLVPDLLKQTYGGPPAVAIFATNARYKREAYRGSEFAPKILADNGLNVVMKSDHPVLDSRYLVFEAAQAAHYGLNFSQAVGSVTTHPAKAMGMDHRIGHLREGYDADVVVWDSWPLVLGATPKQTYIDGIPQIIKPHTVEKGADAQEIPSMTEGIFDEDIAETLASRGEPDLRPRRSSRNVIFQGVEGFYLPPSAVPEGSSYLAGDEMVNGTVLVQDGQIACVGDCVVENGLEFDMVDLKGGSISPGWISAGSYLGLMEIQGERSTWDGPAYEPLVVNSDIVEGLLVHAVDGVRFGGRDELIAYKSGVTSAITAPITGSLFSGLSCHFSTSAAHPLAPGAILNPSGALHISLAGEGQSVSTDLAVLRRLLLGELGDNTELKKEVHAVKRGYKRLVVEVNRADVMAAMVRMKRDVAPGMAMTFMGGAEAWMIADELVEHSIGVVVSPSRSFPKDWNSRRIMPGLPLSEHSLVSYLASKGVLVGLGIREEWEARNTFVEAAWQYANALGTGAFSKQDAIDLVSKNLEELLGLNDRASANDLDEAKGAGSWVAYEGDMFGLNSRVRGVKPHGGEEVDLW